MTSSSSSPAPCTSATITPNRAARGLSPADGRNLAFYKEHDDSDEGSFFIYGKLNEFSGAYWHDSQFGYGHWAVHEEVPGQKFFRWSLARSGAIWESLLTDSDGPYFEPQNGRLLDQNDHEFFAPSYDRPMARAVLPLQADRAHGEGHPLRRAERAQRWRRNPDRLLRPAAHR